MRNYLTETQWGVKWTARPAYIWGLRDPQNGACYIWTDQSAAENTATPVIECDPATGEAKSEAYPVHVCKVVAKYVDINAEQFLGWTFGSEDICLEVKTVRTRVKEAIDNYDTEGDSLNKLLALAYYMGREEATREVSDKYNAHLAAQHERAEACRYYKMAAAIVGPEKFLYCPDYAGEMSATFGNDATEL